MWANHPRIGYGTITAGGSSARTLFIPWRFALGLLGLLTGVWLALATRRRRNRS